MLSASRLSRLSRLSIRQASLFLLAVGSLTACRKDPPAEKPKPVVVKKSPAEMKQLADSATQQLEGLKPLLAGLNAKFDDLHKQIDPLPSDLPEFGETRSKFYAADEGLGRMNTKVSLLPGQLDAAVKAGDGAELEEVTKAIARTYEDVPQVDRVAMELFHEAPKYQRAAEQVDADKKAACETNKGDTMALTAAEVGKKLK